MNLDELLMDLKIQEKKIDAIGEGVDSLLKMLTDARQTISELQIDKQCLMARCFMHTHGSVCRYCTYNEECEFYSKYKEALDKSSHS